MNNLPEKTVPAEAAAAGNSGNPSNRIKVQIAAVVVGKSVPILLAIMLLGSIAVWIAGPGHESRYVPPALCAVSLLLVWQLMRTGRILLAANVYIAILCMAILVGMTLNGGIRAPVFSGFLPIIAMVGWLYGSRSALAILAVAVAAGAVFVVLDLEGWLQPKPPAPAMLVWILTTGSLVITLCVTTIPHRMLHRSLTQSEMTRQRLEATTHALGAAKTLAEKAQAAAESASKAKDQFIAMLSHELRTPLTPTVVATSLLRRDGRLPDDVRADLEMISRNVELEVRLIDDLLDVSRIVSGKLHLEKRPVDAAVAIREAAKVVSADLDARGQTLILEASGAPYLIFADAARLQQVFWNLLRNSIKFSPPHAHITMRATFTPMDQDPLAPRSCPAGMDECPLPQAADGRRQECQGTLLVEVIDQGSGIDAEMLPRLFNPFEQAEKSRSFGGLGLGLSICKAVVEKHGGSISASSDGISRGATFTVRLPVAQCSIHEADDQAVNGNGKHTDRPPQKSSRPLRILLVEDHLDTAKLLRRLLTAEGHDVTTADTVAGGLAAVRSTRPDLLISDLGLPDGNGLDLLRQLRAEGQHFPAIAFSGFGTAADIANTKAAGFAEHLVKPISSVDALTSAIKRLGF